MPTPWQLRHCVELRLFLLFPPFFSSFLQAKRVAWNSGWFRRLLAVGAAGLGAARRADGAPARLLDFVMVAGMHTLLNQTAFSSGMLDAAQVRQ